ncbi:Serine/threonine protein kinase [Handroanthus impetiginosus]|uniref:Serine/threonine protein kinase n=1 Tax=Handroanthus impetiginosus TaxID=429701 RepID=A0A2G9I8Y1_9LAMI|nr:Serine/threonine protein kinase [Handroanthus impetiginosus]
MDGDAVTSVGEIQFNSLIFAGRVAQVIYSGKVLLWDSNLKKLTDFTTRFPFTVDTQNSSEYGYGIAFFLAPIGFQIPPNSATEFDSFVNSEWDPQHEHVGINKNSLKSSVIAPWNVTLHSGQPADIWIVYNSTTKNLNLSNKIDLKEVLPQWVAVGICASTGKYSERHIVESWEFRLSLELDINERDKNKAKAIGLIVGIAISGCIFMAGAIVVVFLVFRKHGDDMEDNNNPQAANLTLINYDLKRGLGPRRFSYKDLTLATNNFSDERKLGEGGFGGVCKGYPIDLHIPVAVKNFSIGYKQGKKQNLVHLIGLCHDQGEFLLVYEFIPKQCRLDYHLFGRSNQCSWTLRHKIALDLAPALLYLHEEREQCVVHRDINPQMTGLAGTVGSLAHEYVSTGRASTESDVYSFGAVALEIATGRKSADKQFKKGLVEWVWDLYGNGELISAAKQAECLMIVGLWCAHLDQNLRPSIRQAIRVLSFETELPKLPMKMPKLFPLITSSSINVGG